MPQAIAGSNAPRPRPMLSASGRDVRVDAMRGAALVMIFIDHCTGNIFSHATLQHLQFADAAEIFFLLSGYSCMAAYGGQLDRGQFRAAARAIGRRCATLYVAQLLTLILAEMLVSGWGFSEPLPVEALHPLSGVNNPALGAAMSELFRVNTWTEIAEMATMLGEPQFFDILRTYIVLLLAFPLLWFGLRRSPVAAFVVSAALWLASHGAHGLRFYDWLQHEPWPFNPFGWQFIVLCGAAMRVIVVRGGVLPKHRAVTALSLAIVLAGLGFHACYLFGVDPPHPLMGRVNLSPVRLASALALAYLALSRPWPGGRQAMVIVTLASLLGRQSLLVFSVGLLLSVNADLAFISFGQDLPVQLAATLGSLAVMLAVAFAAERHKRGTPRLQTAPPL